jgi:hypothetical protein
LLRMTHISCIGLVRRIGENRVAVFPTSKTTLGRARVAKNDLDCTFLTWRSRESWLRITFVVKVLTLRSDPVWRWVYPVERLYCKRPILWLASSKTLTPPPRHRPASVYPPRLVRGENTLAGGRGGGGQYFGRRQTLRCTLHT